MRITICILFALCCFVDVKGEEPRKLKDMDRDETDRYERILKAAVKQYGGMLLPLTYKNRITHDTEVQEGSGGDFTITFYSLIRKCTVFIQDVVDEPDGSKITVHVKPETLKDNLCTIRLLSEPIELLEKWRKKIFTG
ncbi:hypothetical protein GE061_017797 [Apolygus lucorum]|uniref:DUF3888 domain-containing protein n=1 Tax=Apolygus lucorum TaxID=248454 RepID=A0A8S9XC64_APOLU|nr:hypothetical protein GE061_017797 [Apolygus lucorum]